MKVKSDPYKTSFVRWKSNLTPTKRVLSYGIQIVGLQNEFHLIFANCITTKRNSSHESQIVGLQLG